VKEERKRKRERRKERKRKEEREKGRKEGNALSFTQSSEHCFAPTRSCKARRSRVTVASLWSTNASN
jgi:hypothetical protein